MFYGTQIHFERSRTSRDRTFERSRVNLLSYIEKKIGTGTSGPVSPIILREIRGSIDHRWSNVTTFFKKPIPRLYCGDPWAIDSRRTTPSRIFKKTVPVSRGSEGRPPPSPRRSTPSVARPLPGSPHYKSSPSQSLPIRYCKWSF